MVKENEITEAMHERAKIIVEIAWAQTHLELTIRITVVLQCKHVQSLLLMIRSTVVLSVQGRETRGTSATQDMELLYRDGLCFLGRPEYAPYLHILTKQDSSSSDDGPQPWQGITGRVKQETQRLKDTNWVDLYNFGELWRV